MASTTRLVVTMRDLTSVFLYSAFHGEEIGAPARLTTPVHPLTASYHSIFPFMVSQL